MLKRATLLLPLLLLSNAASAERLKCYLQDENLHSTLELDTETKKAMLTSRYDGRVKHGEITVIGEHNFEPKYHLNFPTTNGPYAGRATNKQVLAGWHNGSWRLHSATLVKAGGEWVLNEVDPESFVRCTK